MRVLCFTAVLVVGIARASAAANANAQKKKEEKLENTSFVVALVTDTFGQRRLEAIPKPELYMKRKKAMTHYHKAVEDWRRDYAAFRKQNPKATAKDAPPQPQMPRVIVVKERIRGLTKAREELAELEKQYARILNPPEDAGRAPTDGPPRPECMPQGNLAGNPGFEEMHPRTSFAAGWLQDQWGRRGAQFHIRSDKSNPHSGDWSVLVRSLTEGGKPGVYRTLEKALPMGSYEVRFWACCQVGGRAVVGAELAGVPAGQTPIGEEWQQVRARVTIDTQQRKPVLKLWSETPRVKVFFDDVEVIVAPVGKGRAGR